MDYISENHSKHMMMAHLIFVCKHRKRLLSAYGDFMKEQFYSIAENSDFTIDDLRFIINYIGKIELPQNLKDRVLKIINL